MLNTVELLGRLDAKGIRPSEIARALNISPSRVTEIRKGERSVKLDEAAKLVAAFDLEPPPPPARAVTLPDRVVRLLAEYLALELGCEPESIQSRIGELTKDVRAFAVFVSDPSVRESAEAAEMFFQALRLRRQAAGEEAPEESDPSPLR